MKIKKKGAYAYDLQLHQDHSALIIQKAAEAFLVHGTPVNEFITRHDDMFDFMLRTKVPRSSKLIGRVKNIPDQKLQNITRYYVSNAGMTLVKVMPPTDTMLKNWDTLSHWYHETNGQHKCAPKPPSGTWRLGVKPSELPPDREISIESGWLVTPCNNLSNHVVRDINYEYYIKEAEKLCLGLRCRDDV